MMFGFSWYAALASLTFPILSTCSLHFLLHPDHLTASGILSHCFWISLFRCLILSVVKMALTAVLQILAVLVIDICFSKSYYVDNQTLLLLYLLVFSSSRMYFGCSKLLSPNFQKSSFDWLVVQCQLASYRFLDHRFGFWYRDAHVIFFCHLVQLE